MKQDKDGEFFAFFNLIEFAINPQIWEERKEIVLKDLEKEFKRKEFIEKHLSENFTNLIPDTKLLNDLGNNNNIGFRLCNNYQSPNFKFILMFHFTTRKIFDESEFEFEIKLKDIATNCKVINKRSLRKIFHKLLLRVGYEIGYVQGMIDEIDLSVKILRNERETIKVKESIFDLQKIFYDYVCRIVKDQNHLYNYLFPFFDYFSKLKGSISEREFSRFIADITDNNIDSESIRQTFIKHRDEKKIPKLW